MVSREQLLAAGVSRNEIAHRLSAGSLHPYHRGVYAVGHRALPPLAPEAAAVLACGPGAAISFLSAAFLWGLLPRPAGPVHVSRAGRHRDGPVGVVSHRCTTLETTRRHGIPVTTPLRTLLDIAVVASDRDLARAVTEARIRRLVTDGAILTGAVRRPGAQRLRELAAQEPSRTRSEAERRLLLLVERARLPRPVTNVRLHGYEVDALWPEQRLVAEVDGYAFHGHRQAFERDRRRDAALTSAGYTTVRLTWRQIAEEAEATAAVLAGALARCGG